MTRLQKCSACGESCSASLNMCPTCHPVVSAAVPEKVGGDPVLNRIEVGGGWSVVEVDAGDGCKLWTTDGPRQSCVRVPGTRKRGYFLLSRYAVLAVQERIGTISEAQADREREALYHAERAS